MDSIAVWGCSFDAQITAIDFQTVAPRSSGDTRLRLKNTSAQYTATGVTLSVTGADADQYLLSLNGVSFTASLSLGTLQAQALTPTIWLRRVTPSTASLGTTSATLATHAAAWLPSA